MDQAAELIAFDLSQPQLQLWSSQMALLHPHLVLLCGYWILQLERDLCAQQHQVECLPLPSRFVRPCPYGCLPVDEQFGN